MALTIGLTMIIPWTILFPLFVTWRLYTIRDSFAKPKNLKQFGLFYVGLNDNVFYWEIIIVNLRKLILIMCVTLLGSS